jgi:hypothetical protein
MFFECVFSGYDKVMKRYVINIYQVCAAKYYRLNEMYPTDFVYVGF